MGRLPPSFNISIGPAAVVILMQSVHQNFFYHLLIQYLFVVQKDALHHLLLWFEVGDLLHQSVELPEVSFLS